MDVRFTIMLTPKQAEAAAEVIAQEAKYLRVMADSNIAKYGPSAAFDAQKATAEACLIVALALDKDAANSWDRKGVKGLEAK